jgi:DNA-binding MarR family transcriptional regulator
MAQSPRKDQSSPLDLLHRVCLKADNLFARNIGEIRLTPRQYAVLRAVAQADGLNQMAIMAATGIDKSTTAEVVRRLVSNGALQRRRKKLDARQYAVRLTAKGREMLTKGELAARAADEALLLGVAPALRTCFLEALGQIAARRSIDPREPTT